MTRTNIFHDGGINADWTVYDDIAAALDEDVALTIFEELSGTELKVPLRIDTLTGRLLASILGDDRAQEFCQAFHGDQMYFLSKDGLERKARRNRIVQKLKAGECTVLEIARIEGVSDRHVRNLKRRHITQ